MMILEGKMAQIISKKFLIGLVVSGLLHNPIRTSIKEVLEWEEMGTICLEIRMEDSSWG